MRLVSRWFFGAARVSLAVFVFLLGCTWPQPVWAELAVRSALLLDMGTGKILYEQNADEPIPPASLTKILTMYMALERAERQQGDFSTPIRVSKGAARTGGSRMGLRPYERVSLENLLMGMAVASGNDASCAVAEFLGGSQQSFVAQMNAKAAALGLTASTFCNPHGLPARGQMTTARDMLTLSHQYLRAYPQALRYHSTRYMRHNGLLTYNKNPMLGIMAGADGLKSGWINASGYNLVSTAHRGDTRLLAVVLGAVDGKLRAREMYRLLEAGFTVTQARTASHRSTALPPAVTEVLPTVVIPHHDLIYDAYATLAPSTVKRPDKAIRHKGLKKQNSGRKGASAIRTQDTRKARKPQRDETRQASLIRTKG